MKGWRDLSVIISAYIIKHYETTKEEIKLEEAGKKIHEIGKADKIIGLVAPSTIKDELSKISAGQDYFNQLEFYAFYLFTRG